MPLTKVYQALSQIANVSSREDKKYYIKKYINEIGRPFYMTLRYVGEPTLKFNVKSIPFLPNIKAAKNDIEIFDYLDYLSSKRGATQDEKRVLAAIASSNEETVEVVNRILAKNLKCGVSDQTIKEFVTDITDPGVMLCGYKVEVIKKYDDVSSAINLFVKRCGGWHNVVGHVKLDGMRIKYSNGSYFTRGALDNQFFSFLKDELHVLEETVRKIIKFSNNEYPIEFDGEIMYEGELNSTATDYSLIKDIDIDKLVYRVFDIPNIGFHQKERIEVLEKALNSLTLKQIAPIDTYYFSDETDMLLKFDSLVAEGNEGLVLKNARANYQPKKSGDWCKVKLFDTIDLPVVSVTQGKGKFKGTVGTFHCLHKGKVVDVARGACSDGEARFYLKNPPEIIEVKFQEETPDGAFRFPTFFRDRSGDK
jgi:DNA ligase-1